ncbi:MAG: hypothetical protein RL434_3156 [Pseudomonadota bacterium]|jgi:hypothetical protein
MDNAIGRLLDRLGLDSHGRLEAAALGLSGQPAAMFGALMDRGPLASAEVRRLTGAANVPAVASWLNAQLERAGDCRRVGFVRYPDRQGRGVWRLATPVITELPGASGSAGEVMAGAAP